MANGAAPCCSRSRTRRPGKRAWYGMFPQLGAPIGFLFSGGIFLLLSETLSDAQFFSFRLASAVSGELAVESVSACTCG